jgi:hypothetical protein
MPRPRAVEIDARGYQKAAEVFEMPRACPVEFSRLTLSLIPVTALAGNVRLQGTRPWHPRSLTRLFVADKRESPRLKAAASTRFLTKINLRPNWPMVRSA